MADFRRCLYALAVVALLAGLSVPASAQSISCLLAPDMTEGPYWVDEKLLRSDIRTDPSDGRNVFGGATRKPRPQQNGHKPEAGAQPDLKGFVSRHVSPRLRDGFEQARKELGGPPIFPGTMCESVDEDVG